MDQEKLGIWTLHAVNIIKHDTKKQNNIKYALEGLERNKNDIMKMHEGVKTSNDWHPKKN